MATENVDIRFRETGARVIKRKIDEMGQAANNATRGIFLMQRALFVLGGAGALVALVRQIDTLTNYENRLKLTTSSMENLNAVSKELFETARRGRSSFESVAEIYTRTALSVKSLGISQKEVIRFTESLSKSTIISGASAREAHAAMIQLGQGMASNTLRGDELRSVLEQLPFVADVIAKHFKVTRGELRVLGEEGKISAKDILEAFKNAQVEIDALFANTTPTIEQALTVANVNWLQFLDTVDDTTGISADVASAIIVISKNIDILVGSLAALAAAWAFTFSAKLIQRIFNWIAGLREGAVRYTRLIEIENTRASSSVRMAAATQAANVANAEQIAIGIVQLQQNRVLLTQQRLEEAVIIKNGRARSALTGQFVSLTAAKAALNKTTIALINNERALTASGAALAASNSAQAGAANTLAAANSRLAASQAASATFGARLARTFPLIAGGLALVGRGITALWVLLSANPIGIVIAAIGLLILVLYKFGNNIKITKDGIIGLWDYIVAAIALAVRKIGEYWKKLVEISKTGVDKMVKWFSQFKFDIGEILFEVAKMWYNLFIFIPRLAVSVTGGIIRAWKVLPDSASEIMTGVANAFIIGFEDIVNSGIEGINKLIKSLNDFQKESPIKAALLFGMNEQITEFAPIELPKIDGDAGDLGKKIIEEFFAGYKEQWESMSLENFMKNALKFLKPLHEAILKEARARKAAEAELNGGGGAGGPKMDPKFLELLDAMNQEINLLKLTGEARRIESEIIKIEKSLKRELTVIEEQLATATIKRMLSARDQAKIYEEIKSPMENYRRNLQAIILLYIKGRISIDEFNRAIQKNRIEMLDTQTGAMAGLERGLLKINDSANDAASGMENALTNAFDGVTDAFLDFVKTGKLSFKSLVDSLIADLTRLAFQKAVIGAISGALSASFGGAAGGGETGDGISSFAHGGSIMPSGPGTADTQLMIFKKRPDERVDILTPEQQKKSSGSRSVTINQTIQIMNPTDVDGFQRSQGQIASRSLASAQRVARRLG